MEELSAVGEQVFDAECILNKRLRKVRAVKLLFIRVFCLVWFVSVCSAAHQPCPEQEKELLMRKRGKRPRGRPRKILVSTVQSRTSFCLDDNVPEAAKSSSSSSGSSSSSSDSSSSCSSSSSSSEDEDDDSHVKQANPSVRARELHPVPQKKAQIVMAKQEPPKKRSRKPLPPEMKEFPQNKGSRKILKTTKDADLPGAIKKPVHPASFTFMGFHRGSARDAVSGQNRSSLAQGGAVKNSMSPVGSGRSSVQPASASMNKSSQSRNVTDGKLSISNMSSGTSLDLKAAASKSKGVAALNLNTSKHPVQGTTQHTLSSPNGQKKPQAPVPTVQRIPNAKPSLPSKNASSNQGSGLQLLNLQNKVAQTNDAPGNGTTPTSVQGRLEKSSVHKSSAEVQSQHERSASKDGKKAKMNDMSTGEEESSSDSDQDSSYAGQGRSVTVQNQDWKPTRSLIEHVFVTDVTANLVTVTVKESPTSVGFFSIRNY
uniref:Chromobox homolog 2 (Drosophila Pc class) n=1 Tax=Stegastes partitus TaxID=144197 RepID=A0A3B5AP31_9TELE